MPARGLRLEQAINRIQRGVADLLNQKQMQDLGEAAVFMIRKRTLNGFGVAKLGSSASRLKPLSDSYKKYRRRNALRLSPLTSPTRSNLTFSSEMLASLDVVRTRTGRVIIHPTGRRNDGYTNFQISKFVAKQGRSFNTLSRNELKKLKQYTSQELADNIQNRLDRT